MASVSATLLAVALAAAGAPGCGPPEDRASTPPADTVARGDTMTPDAEPDRSVHEVLAEHREGWMARPEVTGTGIGRCDGAPCIVVYLRRHTPEVEEALPDTVGGHPVRLEVTGRFEPRAGPGAAGEEGG